MSIWVAPLAALGIIATFLTIGAVAIYCVDQIFNQDAKHRCPTCGRPTHRDYSHVAADADTDRMGKLLDEKSPICNRDP
ncbi:hypothetical protein [Streptomyces sp. MZ04]|uniref:hypothetical protein n=1 Tax=Streptomyces sp. MZ04 TaxID=2559236 RepID=UPI00107EC988|nr:hypothetical protein [Streptomyces sp. MZ04]TGB13873.1 hypothetical protein E2651_08005 [Streptomyces sp. MZ04]